ncbi:MAG: DUF362 domain-containing protein [Candidatus Lokiarchaeota archaeon]|nr:DUF362 domain-containing protein [Candidatus Lokiarchaeota archaeon]
MISIVRVPATRSARDTLEPIQQLLEQIDYRPSSRKVFIKPNMVDATSPLEAVDTDPALVGGLVLALKERGADEFAIGDGTGYFNEEKNWLRLVEESGYKAMADDLEKNHGIGLTIVNLETAPREGFPWKFGSIKLPSLCRTHAYINFAKMKTHVHTQVTLACKNQKGLLSLADKKAFHLGKKYSDLHENIKALASAVRPELAIVDATRALEGSGPTTAPAGQTKVRRLKLCLGGPDMVEVDNAACQLMGIPVDSVRHLNRVPVAVARGSEPLQPIVPPFVRPNPEIMATDNFFVHMSETCCTGCQMSRSRMFRKISFVPDINQLFARFRYQHGRVDFVMGSTSDDAIEAIKGRGGTLVFYGNCTKAAADKFGGIHVPGCPPDHNVAIDVLLGKAG